jgi:hypothetical protein
MIAGSDDGYEEIATQISEAASLAVMQKIVDNICKFYHLANMAYHAVYNPGAKMFNPILALTKDPGWVARYKDNDNFKIDRVVVPITKNFFAVKMSGLP